MRDYIVFEELKAGQGEFPCSPKGLGSCLNLLGNPEKEMALDYLVEIFIGLGGWVMISFESVGKDLAGKIRRLEQSLNQKWRMESNERRRYKKAKMIYYLLIFLTFGFWRFWSRAPELNLPVFEEVVELHNVSLITDGIFLLIKDESIVIEGFGTRKYLRVKPELIKFVFSAKK